jgi:hypothetical protein
VQVSPPLVAAQAEFDELVEILGDVLTEAWERVGHGPPSPGEHPVHTREGLA